MKHRKKRLVLPLVLLLLLGSFLLLRSRPPLTVLMYHECIPDGAPESDWVITPSRLEDDLRFLAENGYTTVLPRELAAGRLDNGEPLPEKPVLLTLDDGYESGYTLVYPLLQRCGAKAAISLVVGWVDEGKAGYLTWDECREMQASGLVEFGSHTYSLHEADGIAAQSGETREAYRARVLPDLEKSSERMEAELGCRPALFAYPLGKQEHWARSRIDALFPVSVTSRYGKVPFLFGLHRLPRCNVTQQRGAAVILTENYFARIKGAIKP